ncbi:hypothetical protein NUH88_13180 [Nisaea acidiphila]|uniref:CMP-N-acetylneuraminic acid synthetase n=1 Tax=Nisaea acidiphila TaxID=1862145 RepID=A0A9J7ASN8_9PROT|nr:hypothetical protein [Nisaea acidiphila]UUX48365.1 hypothetical protein NUH88_13180 [Nisaea acidiphila]
MSDTLIIIPVYSGASSTPRIVKPLDGTSSLVRTIEAALEDLPDARIVLTADDNAVKQQAAPYADRITIHDRTAESYTDALVDVLDAFPAEQVVVIEPTHPFRPRGLIRRTAENLAAREHLDSVVCVRQFDASLWRLDPDKTIQALGPGGDRRSSTYFQEVVGLALATRPELIREGRRLGDAVGFEVVDQFWALVDIRDDMSLAMAEMVADRFTEFRNSIA